MALLPISFIFTVFILYGAHGGIHDPDPNPVPGKIYAIQSRMDGGVIKPRANGIACNRLGSVGFSYNPPTPYATEFRWQIIEGNNGTIIIQSLKEDEASTVNELTYINQTQPQTHGSGSASACDLVKRQVKLIIHPVMDTFIIQDVHTGKCLYSYGSEVGLVIWRDDPYTQYWAFHELI